MELFRCFRVNKGLENGFSAIKGRKDLLGEAAAGGEVEEDEWLLLTKDVPARYSRWSQVCRLLSLLVSDVVADEMENGGPLAGRYFSSVSHIAGREGWLLLLQLRKGVASTGSIIVAEEGYGRRGGYNWASGAELRKRWDEWRVVSWGCVDREGRSVSGVHGGCKLGE
ncbi:hypothetical protein NC652_000594 [Populus alba x Populus x berolinensis]|nr:hypothetical protein NC652_000594 [Populus alba x Populus x berolinensis]